MLIIINNKKEEKKSIKILFSLGYFWSNPDVLYYDNYKPSKHGLASFPYIIEVNSEGMSWVENINYIEPMTFKELEDHRNSIN